MAVEKKRTHKHRCHCFTVITKTTAVPCAAFKGEPPRGESSPCCPYAVRGGRLAPEGNSEKKAPKRSRRFRYPVVRSAACFCVALCSKRRKIRTLQVTTAGLIGEASRLPRHEIEASISTVSSETQKISLCQTDLLKFRKSPSWRFHLERF